MSDDIFQQLVQALNDPELFRHLIENYVRPAIDSIPPVPLILTNQVP